MFKMRFAMNQITQYRVTHKCVFARIKLFCSHIRLPIRFSLHINTRYDKITWDNQEGGKPLEDTQMVGNLGFVVVVGSHRAAARTQLMEELADLSVTCVEKEAPSLPVAVQTCHLSCPFQSCVVSALINNNVTY